MRSLFARLFALLAVPAAAAPAVPPACVVLAKTWQSIELACPLEAVAPQRYRFSASFSGSHDDTALSLTSTLDGAPLACDAGSKTESNGEDGDIVLECRFATTQAAAGGELRVRMKWYHATYEGHAFAAVDAALAFQAQLQRQVSAQSTSIMPTSTMVIQGFEVAETR